MKLQLGDITSPRLLVAKGALFLVSGLLASAGLAVAAAGGWEWWKVLFFHAAGVWSFCRAYYFAFYVLEKYVDPQARYAGLMQAARVSWRVVRSGAARR